MNRDDMLARLKAHIGTWDMIVIGGGATGMGIAVDAASRGFSVLLLEREDFGKGTSSRSTKLVHGGVRYLEQGNIPLVREALRERGLLRRNAPHIVHDLAFVVPNYRWWQVPFYGVGLAVYDLLAGKYGFGHSHVLSRRKALARAPNLQPKGLKGAVVYHDGQFDDSRLLIHLAMTAANLGAVLLNHAAVTAVTKDAGGKADGVVVRDGETGETATLAARVVINATGMFSDEVRRLAEPSAESTIAPSQGVHLVFDGSFLSGGSAILVPHTRDGRVLFAIPWHGHTLAGTTDTPVVGPSYEPVPLEEEIRFILDTIGRYLDHAPRRGDVLSVFTGIRPLVKPEAAKGTRTASLSRGHTIHVDASGLLSIAGGKWTTYRAMAEDVVTHAIELGSLPAAECHTQTLRLHGWREGGVDPLAIYGTDAESIKQLTAQVPELGRRLHSALPYIAAEVVWAVRQEMARTLDDVLARRLRALFLNAKAALEMAPEAAALMAKELGRSDGWIAEELQRFEAVAAHYILPPIS